MSSLLTSFWISMSPGGLPEQKTTCSYPQPTNPPTFPSIQYINKALPASYDLPPKTGDVKISAWNITSLKSACDKKHGSGFRGYMDKEDADIMILTETKRNDSSPIPEDVFLKEKYPFQEWAFCSKKGYAGTAVLSKVKPITKSVDLVVKGERITGRIVQMEFPSLFLIGTYAPNASEGLKNMQGKKDWNVAFEAKLRELDAIKPVVWGGDINVVASGNDISNAAKGWNKLPGWTQDELDGYMSQLNPSSESGHQPLVDAWREIHGPDEVQYSFHSKRSLQREKGLGWRLDTFVVSKRLQERVKACEIRREIFGPSDHVPVVIELSGSL
ncbi:exodeoxyribonuclease iii [Phaffia rhodozyma]|uniref:Exodeoxyribonuclease iii n=1 Tax=Phaffia rhodozyma TaxID=264483 RepID=A0A0F7SRL4_PHARH|nr:exodeoxyribonuclease iii [Phaffia rhodozyma]